MGGEGVSEGGSWGLTVGTERVVPRSVSQRRKKSRSVGRKTHPAGLELQSKCSWQFAHRLTRLSGSASELKPRRPARCHTWNFGFGGRENAPVSAGSEMVWNGSEGGGIELTRLKSASGRTWQAWPVSSLPQQKQQSLSRS